MQRGLKVLSLLVNKLHLHDSLNAKRIESWGIRGIPLRHIHLVSMQRGLKGQFAGNSRCSGAAGSQCKEDWKWKIEPQSFRIQCLKSQCKEDWKMRICGADTPLAGDVSMQRGLKDQVREHIREKLGLVSMQRGLKALETAGRGQYFVLSSQCKEDWKTTRMAQSRQFQMWVSMQRGLKAAGEVAGSGNRGEGLNAKRIESCNIVKNSKGIQNLVSMQRGLKDHFLTALTTIRRMSSQCKEDWKVIFKERPLKRCLLSLNAKRIERSVL